MGHAGAAEGQEQGPKGRQGLQGPQGQEGQLGFQKVLVNPKDDTGQSEIGSWYIRVGQREKGEELIAKALNRNADEMWHYVRAAEAYLGVPKGK